MPRRTSTALLLLVSSLVGCSKTSPPSPDPEPVAPIAAVEGVSPIGATEIAVDRAQVPASLQAVFDHIDAHFGEHVAYLQEWVRQPGISLTGEGMRDSATFVKRLFDRLGCQETQLYDVETEGPEKPHPIVYARCQEGAPRTLLVYWRYDTGPLPEPDAWTSPPYHGAIGGRPPFPKVLVGHGANSPKGSQIAMWNALMSYKAVHGKLPVNLIFVAEGDRERLSIGLRRFMPAHPELFRGAEAVWLPGGQNASGRASIGGSSEGYLSFELTTSGGKWGHGPTRGDIHGHSSNSVDNPGWRHMKMLETLIETDGHHARVEGFYDNIEPLSPEALARLEEEAKTVDLAEAARQMGVARFITDDPLEYLKMMRYGGSFNLDGIWAGNTEGGGGGSVVPGSVTSKHNVRYVPRQDGADLIQKIRRHLDKHGYADVEMKVLGDVPWSKAIMTSALTEAQMAALDLFQVPYTPPLDVETVAGTYWPAYLFTRDPLQLPVSRAGGGYGGNGGNPDEFYVIEGAGHVYGLAGAEKIQAAVLHFFAHAR